MPETRAQAEKRAEATPGFSKKDVYCLEGDNKCFLIPHGIETTAAKKAYAEARLHRRSREYAAKVAHKVESQAK